MLMLATGNSRDVLSGVPPVTRSMAGSKLTYVAWGRRPQSMILSYAQLTEKQKLDLSMTFTNTILGEHLDLLPQWMLVVWQEEHLGGKMYQNGENT